MTLQLSTGNTVWDKTTIDTLRLMEVQRKLFQGKHDVVFVLPDGSERPYDYVVINWLGDVLSQTWKRFLFREFPVITDENQSTEIEHFIENLDLPTIALPSELRKSYCGQAVIKAYYSKLSNKVCFKLWGANEGEYVTLKYLANDKSKPYQVIYWYRVSYDNDSNVAIVAEVHTLVLDTVTFKVTGVQIKNFAYVAIADSTLGYVPGNALVSWDKLWRGSINKPAETEMLYLDEIPSVVVNNMDRNGDGTGDTDYTDSLIYIQKNINKLAIIRQVVIDMSEQPLLTVPPEYIDPETEKVDMRRVRLRVKYNGEASDNDIDVTNWTGNLQNSAQQWEIYRQEFYALSGISPVMAGVIDTQARSGLAKRLNMTNTEAEITARRHQWNLAFDNLVRIAVKLNNLYSPIKINLPTTTLIKNWVSPIPTEDTESTNEIVAAVGGGVKSIEAAVEDLPANRKRTKIWKDAEIKRLKEQAATSTAQVESAPPVSKLFE